MPEKNELLAHEVFVNLVRKSAIQLVLHSMQTTGGVQPGTPYHQWLSNHLSTLPHAQLLSYPEAQIARLSVGYSLVKQRYPSHPVPQQLAALDNYFGQEYLRGIPEILISPENYIMHAVRIDDTAELFRTLDDERLREIVRQGLRTAETVSATAEAELESMSRYTPSAAAYRS